MAFRKQPEPAKKQCKPRRQPEERLHERAWDDLTAKVYTKPEGEKPKPTVRKPSPEWDRPWEEGSAEAAKGFQPKRAQPKRESPDVQFLYEKKVGKHSAVESPSSEASYGREPKAQEARKRPRLREDTPEDPDDDLSAEVNRWNPFNGRKQPKGKGGW
ncbi:hypothetical protein Hte_007039 [Hypoxylon texense]